MRRLSIWMQVLFLAASLSLLAPAILVHAQQQEESDEEEAPRLPSGKLQRDEILKAEYKQNLQDTRRLVELAQALEARLEKDDRFVVSVQSIKDTEEIEKLAKRIRDRLKKY